MTFTLDDAIRHEKEMADSGCGSTERANEHRQIAFWLEELKTRRRSDAMIGQALKWREEE